MLLAISHITSLDLQAGILAVLGGNVLFIAILSLLPQAREKLVSRLTGF